MGILARSAGVVRRALAQTRDVALARPAARTAPGCLQQRLQQQQQQQKQQQQRHHLHTVAALPNTNAHVKTSDTVPGGFQGAVAWPTLTESAEDWLARQPVDDIAEMFTTLGYTIVQNLLSPEELAIYRQLYDDFLSGKIDVREFRHDLGSHVDPAENSPAENVTQIMWPSDRIEHLASGPIHTRIAALSRILIGDDAVFDFDMLISKEPGSNTEVPWHQDQAYWPELPDKRALSAWTAIDDATIDNGCMWFSPRSHKGDVLAHRPAKEGHHALTCNYDGTGAVACEIPAGACTIHAGATLHHTRGNTSTRPRRAYIAAFRPQSMVDFMRSGGFDHGRQGLDNLDYDNAGTAYKKMK